MKDPELEAFIEAIESHLTALRGTPHTLTPPDFALARGWHQAGIGLSTVLSGIDRAATQRGPQATLAGCRRFVEQVLDSGATREPPAAPGSASAATATRSDDCLATLGPGLVRLPEALGLPLRARVLAMQQAVAAGPELRELDIAVTAAALQALPVALRQALEQEAEVATARQRGRVSAAALAAAQARFVADHARAHFGLPAAIG